MPEQKRPTRSKTGNNAEIRFQHYRFELELHPDDDPEGLHQDLDNFHID